VAERAGGFVGNGQRPTSGQQPQIRETFRRIHPTAGTARDGRCGHDPRHTGVEDTAACDGGEKRLRELDRIGEASRPYRGPARSTAGGAPAHQGHAAQPARARRWELAAPSRH
jgi:hypothetical protein